MNYTFRLFLLPRLKHGIFMKYTNTFNWQPKLRQITLCYIMYLLFFSASTRGRVVYTWHFLSFFKSNFELLIFDEPKSSLAPLTALTAFLTIFGVRVKWWECNKKKIPSSFEIIWLLETCLSHMYLCLRNSLLD